MHHRTTWRRLRAALLTLSAVAGITLAGVTAASAAPAPVPHSPTIQCQVALPGACVEIGFAQAIPSSQNLVPASDIALTTTGFNGSLFTDLNNDRQDFLQDMAIVPLGFVPASGPGAFGFTPKDNLLYHGDPVAELVWAPGGADINQCVQERLGGPLVKHFALRPCDDGFDQLFIIDSGRIPLVGTTPPGYVRVMPILHVPSLAGHDCVTGRLSGSVAAERCVRVTQFPVHHGGPQFVTAIP